MNLILFAGVRGGGPDPVQPLRLPRDLRAHGHRALPHRAQPASLADAAIEEVVFLIIFVPLSISPDDGCTFPETEKLILYYMSIDTVSTGTLVLTACKMDVECASDFRCKSGALLALPSSIIGTRMRNKKSKLY